MDSPLEKPAYYAQFWNRFRARKAKSGTSESLEFRTAESGQGAAQISGWDFRTWRVKGGDSAGMAWRETEDYVRGRTAVVAFVAPPTDDRFSFAIRSASRGNLVRE